MIRAYCDHCGEWIPEDEPAGIMIVLGKKEWKGHLCLFHQSQFADHMTAYFEANPLRKVKG